MVARSANGAAGNLPFGLVYPLVPRRVSGVEPAYPRLRSPRRVRARGTELQISGGNMCEKCGCGNPWRGAGEDLRKSSAASDGYAKNGAAGNLPFGLVYPLVPRRVSGVEPAYPRLRSPRAHAARGTR